jgi:3-dehydroquinate synthase
MNIVLIGPPGVGKTTVGQALAARRGWRFVDVDVEIEVRAGRSVSDLFAEQGEAAFRAWESRVIADIGRSTETVIAPGGGALLRAENRQALADSGILVCLRADLPALMARTASGQRPLLAGDRRAQLETLLAERASLYDSIPEQLETSALTVSACVDALEARLTTRTVAVTAAGFEHEVVLGYGLVAGLMPLLAARGLPRPALVVVDDVIAAQPWLSEVDAPRVVVPSGEAHKTLETVSRIYTACVDHGLDRGSLVVAIGGGVIGDMTGFAAATYMRGVRWVNVPTTLLAMVDASLGGKTGVDLPQGKNLIGAFHRPVCVIADPLVLATLPEAELRSGLAEVIKHGLIADADLWAMLAARPCYSGINQLERAIRVKAAVVSEDPHERGRRAILNVGHTLGHALESASGFRLRHGEAIAVGLVGEARLAARLGVCPPGLPAAVERVVDAAGLPVCAPGLDRAAVWAAMRNDKKKTGGRVRFALPTRIGAAEWGIDIPDEAIDQVLTALIGPVPAL